MASPGESIADGGAMGHFQGGYVAWVVLFVAGLLETGWAVGLKYTEGFTRLWPTLWTVGAIVASLGLLGIAVKTLP
jgi:quaternary ammonium compound-resistance protein SugE